MSSLFFVPGVYAVVALQCIWFPLNYTNVRWKECLENEDSLKTKDSREASSALAQGSSLDAVCDLEHVVLVSPLKNGKKPWVQKLLKVLKISTVAAQILW